MRRRGHCALRRHGRLHASHWSCSPSDDWERIGYSAYQLPALSSLVGMVSVLVVDDDADCREALCELLALQGYRVTAAANADEARAQMAARPPDIAVVDVGPPDMAVTRFIQNLRARAGSRRPTVIAFTGHPRLEAAAREAGCDHFVLKPGVVMLLHTLKAAIAAGAGQARARRRANR